MPNQILLAPTAEASIAGRRSKPGVCAVSLGGRVPWDYLGDFEFSLRCQSFASSIAYVLWPKRAGGGSYVQDRPTRGHPKSALPVSLQPLAAPIVKSGVNVWVRATKEQVQLTGRYSRSTNSQIVPREYSLLAQLRPGGGRGCPVESLLNGQAFVPEVGDQAHAVGPVRLLR